MARAFAVFANQGRDVSPIAIRAVEDRNGRVVLDTERDVRLRQRRLGNEIQVISPQNAYIMTSMLTKTVEVGTLANPSGWGSKFTFKDEKGKNFRMPMAGKTGTPQNWSDAWAVGYSPYYTAAIWFGFDKPGNSLGVNLTGSTLAGPVWADFMREIHQGLPLKEFVKPSTGIIDVTVCTKSGLLKTPGCPGDVTMPFLEGTQPTRFCDLHDSAAAQSSQVNLEVMRLDTLLMDSNSLLGELKLPELRLDQLPQELRRPEPVTRPSTATSSRTRTNTRTSSRTSTISPTTPRTTQTPPRQSAPVLPEVDSRGSDFELSEPPPRNTRNNPIISDEEFGLELPDYNPLLD
jgi:penicillin-binding protein 1A